MTGDDDIVTIERGPLHHAAQINGEHALVLCPRERGELCPICDDQKPAGVAVVTSVIRLPFL